jgi:membrane protease YdiL (CAAX protease family)
MADDTLHSWYRRLIAPFWNGDRVRAPWRIAVAVGVVLVLPGLVLGRVGGLGDLPLVLRGLVANGTYVLIALTLLLVWSRYVDRRRLATYGFAADRRWLRDAALGVALALIVWGGALATDLALGWASIEAVFSPGESGLPFAVVMGLFALQWAFVGVWEEVVFRGLVLRNAVAGLSLPWLSRRTAAVGGLLGSAVLFGGLHASQAASALALGWWVLAGVVLGGAYLLTDSLALPIGLHATFDFAVNNVYGFANVRPAGDRLPMLVRPAFVGPDRFVEIAGLVNTVWLVVAGLLVLGVVRWQYGTLEIRLGGDERVGDDRSATEQRVAGTEAA